MDEAAKDYTEDTEQVVLSRWDKIKKWIEIVMATRKLAMLVWGLIVTTGGSLVVGQVTDTKPIRDAAVSIGLIDAAEAPVGNQSVPEIDLSAYALKGHTHPLVPHKHPEYALVDHVHPSVASTGGLSGATREAIRAEIIDILPPNHGNLH